MTHPLDNVTWHSLSGPHAGFADGRGTVRRYASGFSAIVGFIIEVFRFLSLLRGPRVDDQLVFVDVVLRGLAVGRKNRQLVHDLGQDSSPPPNRATVSGLLSSTRSSQERQVPLDAREGGARKAARGRMSRLV